MGFPTATCEGDAKEPEPILSRPQGDRSCRTVAEKEIVEARERLANAAK